MSVDAGNALVDAIKPLVRSTKRPGSDSEIGGFGGIFDLKAAGFKDPVLVSGTDGVGTKLRVAIEKFGKDMASAAVEGTVISQTSLPWIWKDLLNVYLPLSLDYVKGIPIPRSAYFNHVIEECF